MSGARVGGVAGLVAGILVVTTGLSGLLDATTGMSCAGAAPGRCADEARSVSGMLQALADVHTLSAVVAFAGTGLAPVLLGLALRRAGRPGYGWVSLAVGVMVAGCGVTDLAVLLAGGDVGWLERGRTLLTSVWFAGVAVLLLSEGQRPADGDETCPVDLQGARAAAQVARLSVSPLDGVQ